MKIFQDSLNPIPAHLGYIPGGGLWVSSMGDQRLVDALHEDGRIFFPLQQLMINFGSDVLSCISEPISEKLIQE